MVKQISQLSIKLSANAARLQQDFRAAAGHVNSFGDQIRSVGSSIGGALTSIAGQAAALAGIGSVGGMVGWGLKLAADAEQAQVAFGVLLKSGTAAKQLLAELRAFAAETPFEFPELRDAARSLVAFGVSAGQVPDTLRRIGDIASGIGQPIGEIAELYGKAKVQGRLFAQDINQLTGRGIPIIQQLAAQFGVADSEVRKLVESGQISFANLEQAFISMTSTGGQFAGMMAAQSETLAGRWSTLKDNVGALALEMGEALMPAASKLIDLLSGLVAWLGSLDSVTVGNTLKIVGFAVAFGTVLVLIPKIIAGIKSIVGGLQAMASAQAIATALAGPAGWAKLAVAGGVAAISVAAISSAFEGLTAQADGAAGGARSAAGAVAKIDGKAAAQASGSIGQIAKTAKGATAAVGELREASGQAAAEAATWASQAADWWAKQEAGAARFGDSTAGLQAKAKRWTAELETPSEKLIDQVAELKSLFDQRLITPDIFDRGNKKIREDYEKALAAAEKIEAIKTPAVAAVRRGSAEDLAAIDAARRAAADRQMNVEPPKPPTIDTGPLQAAARRIETITLPKFAEPPKLEMPAWDAAPRKGEPFVEDIAPRKGEPFVEEIGSKLDGIKDAGQQFRDMVSKQDQAARAAAEQTKVLQEIAKNTKDQTKVTEVSI